MVSIQRNNALHITLYMAILLLSSSSLVEKVSGFAVVSPQKKNVGPIRMEDVKLFAEEESSSSSSLSSRRDLFVKATAAATAASVTMFPTQSYAADIPIPEDFTADPRGFYYKIITEGTEDGVVARGQNVKVSYTMSQNGFVYGKPYTPAGSTVESSTNLVGIDDPVKFPVGTGRVIKGWDYAVKDMKVGERRLVVIPPELGYGKNRVKDVPGGSTLYMDITLKAVGIVPVYTEEQKKWLEENPE
uniref:peptidylprolyl isomerase n=1 Tax=Helicotheca tamesis TaxID=374047 RepID=A0A7S2H0A7_9STRA|eukprot:CAMPEP_0185728898 /NCGR_PEP_ID=MMETSP1171-20130828/4307_1 /TAXON_ID=374046 /ORGANISM="Helicotheca tamensis, Strain CCMP826" /LENGTH=244 /DNA_ID=CAMNT_0028397651 /DNA_START=76 /DNA_END=810 /DNA_ORIENTATION=-